MALHVPMPIFGDHEIHLACRLRFRNKESPLHHQMCRTPTFLLSPFGITPWNYPFWIYSFGGFSVGLFSLFYNIFQGGVMPQSYMTWMYVAHTMACGYG